MDFLGGSDNIFKYLFTLGLALIFYGVLIPNEKSHDLSKLQIEFHFKIDETKFRIESLKKEIEIIQLKVENHQIRNVQNELKILQDEIVKTKLQLRKEIDLYKLAIEEKTEYDNIFLWAFWIGITLSILGLSFWFIHFKKSHKKVTELSMNVGDSIKITRL